MEKSTEHFQYDEYRRSKSSKMSNMTLHEEHVGHSQFVFRSFPGHTTSELRAEVVQWLKEEQVDTETCLPSNTNGNDEQIAHHFEGDS